MDFFKKAAAMALSVIGALFTNVEPPKANAQAQPKPVAVQTANVANASRPTVQVTCETQGKLVVVVLRSRNDSVLDPASERFLGMIGNRPSVKHPLTTTPWYMSRPLFAVPGMDDASALFRALVTNDFEDR